MIYIFIIGNPFLLDFTWFAYFHKVTSLNLHNFKLLDICRTFHLSLKKYSPFFALDISRNEIKILRSHCLHLQINMVLLNISRNHIDEIQQLALLGLKSLHIIDLSYNSISFINSNMFLGTDNIIFFGFYGNNLKTIDDLTFKHLISIKLIVTNDFRICCVKPCSNTICRKTHKDSNICQSLIMNNIVITIVFVIAFALTVINLISYCRLIDLGKYWSVGQNTSFEVIAKYLHLSDLSYAMYLILITAGNIYLKISTASRAFHWKGHVVCFFSCVLYIYFQMTSIGVIMFLTLARWLVTKYPLTSRLKHFSFSNKCLRYISTTSLIFSISLSLFYIFYSGLHMLPNLLCTIFYDPLQTTLIQYLALFLGFVQLSASIAIIILHFMLYITSYKSLNVVKSDSQFLSLRKLTIQIILVALCKFICWFHSGIIYILSVSINQFPMKILLYEMIAITPFNSFVNPIFVMFVNRKAKYHKNSIKK